LKRLALWPGNDPVEGVIALQQTIQWLKPGKTLRRQRTPFVLAHKASEPLAQAPRLIGDLVELAGEGLCPNALERVGGTSCACSSQFSKPSPSSIQSIGVSTGVAIELRKSSPSASPTKIAGGRWSISSPVPGAGGRSITHP
jgi:hypothetical protein